MARKSKNQSARDKRRDRERGRRDGRRLTEYPLFFSPPPFEPYSEWINVPDEAKDLMEYPFPESVEVSDGTKDMADLIIKLGPRYRGKVPLAALYLDQQLAGGIVNVAITGQPDRFRPVPLDDLVASIRSPEYVQELKEKYPQATEDLEPDGTVTDEGAAWYIHQLHAHGCLVMDDSHVMNLAIPAQRPGGEWMVNGEAAS
ncbi:hypothetical protein GA0115240_115014 [Streptomyces sp. DvalAA-14]|nr:hypothetical protein GA0115240_115014 [Streptomyces sp. DvalAA-14]